VEKSFIRKKKIQILVLHNQKKKKKTRYILLSRKLRRSHLKSLVKSKVLYIAFFFFFLWFCPFIVCLFPDTCPNSRFYCNSLTHPKNRASTENHALHIFVYIAIGKGAPKREREKERERERERIIRTFHLFSFSSRKFQESSQKENISCVKLRLL
jgi:hypothetical protein